MTMLTIGWIIFSGSFACSALGWFLPITYKYSSCGLIRHQNINSIAARFTEFLFSCVSAFLSLQLAHLWPLSVKPSDGPSQVCGFHCYLPLPPYLPWGRQHGREPLLSFGVRKNLGSHWSCHCPPLAPAWRARQGQLRSIESPNCSYL